MAIEEHKKWTELCNAALDAKDPDELMKILQELKKALKHEEQILHVFWEAMRTNEPRAKIGTAATPVDDPHIRE
jgi:hypothetical protein